MTRIRPMLAAVYNEDHIRRHLLECGFFYMQPKIDGMRVLIDDALIPRSRSWKEWKNRYLRSWAQAIPSLRGTDGEAISGHAYNPEVFRDCMSGLRSEEGSREFTFYVFDVFQGELAQRGYEERLKALQELIERLGEEQQADNYHAKLVLTPTYKVSTIEEIDRLDAKMAANGWEGSILRRPDLPYKWNRSTSLGGHLIKRKGWEDAEFVVTGCFPWEENQNEATTSALGYTVRSAHQEGKVAQEMLGGFTGHLHSDPSVKFKIGVFRGWSHTDRRRLWELRESLPGKVLTFKHQGYGGGYDVPRTPVGLGWRNPVEL